MYLELGDENAMALSVLAQFSQRTLDLCIKKDLVERFVLPEKPHSALSLLVFAHIVANKICEALEKLRGRDRLVPGRRLSDNNSIRKTLALKAYVKV